MTLGTTGIAATRRLLSQVLRVACNAYPTLRNRVRVVRGPWRDFDRAERPDRAFAYTTTDGKYAWKIVVSPDFSWQTTDRQAAILSHEMGHVALLDLGFRDHTERVADMTAEQMLGVKIYYDKDDVQSLRWGRRPRPAYLG